jgi:hypothetical protein
MWWMALTSRKSFDAELGTLFELVSRVLGGTRFL